MGLPPAEEFVGFMTSHGGSRLLGFCIAGVTRWPVRNILGGAAAGIDSISYQLRREIAGPNCLPFADDDGDNLFCLSPDGSVLHAKHDALDGEPARVVSKSFSDWRSSLVIDDA